MKWPDPIAYMMAALTLIYIIPIDHDSLWQGPAKELLQWVLGCGILLYIAFYPLYIAEQRDDRRRNSSKPRERSLDESDLKELPKR